MNFIDDCQDIIVSEFKNYTGKYIFKQSSATEVVNLHTLLKMYFDVFNTGEFIVNLGIDGQILLEASFDIGRPIPEAFQEEIRIILKSIIPKLENLRLYYNIIVASKLDVSSATFSGNTVQLIINENIIEVYFNPNNLELSTHNVLFVKDEEELVEIRTIIAETIVQYSK